MRLPDAHNKWYIEARPQTRAEKISLDLSRHLPCRTTVGPVAIIDRRPNIMLSVIRKRWMHVVKEFEIQYSSTLEPLKKQSLLREINRLKQLYFSVKDTTEPPLPHIVFLKPNGNLLNARFRTIYVVSRMTSDELATILLHLAPTGLLVVYDTWRDEYESAIHIANAARIM